MTGHLPGEWAGASAGLPVLRANLALYGPHSTRDTLPCAHGAATGVGISSLPSPTAPVTLCPLVLGTGDDLAHPRGPLWFLFISQWGEKSMGLVMRGE